MIKAGVSSVVKCDGKLFRYNYDTHCVEYVFKPTKKDKALMDDDELKQIDDAGYMVITSCGLRAENWKKDIREDYLANFSQDIDEELMYM